MKWIFLLISVTLLLPVHADNLAPTGDAQFTKEIDAALREIQTIKPGQSRSELLKVFTTEGGLSQREGRYYVYKKCPEVRFQKVGDLGNQLDEYPDDKITSISKPFLEWSILD